jgi:hypothetical protein
MHTVDDTPQDSRSPGGDVVEPEPKEDAPHMGTAATALPHVVVIGDIQRDTVLVRRPSLETNGSDDLPCPGIEESPLIPLTRDGGAWLLHDTISFALRGNATCSTYHPFSSLPLDDTLRALCPGSLVTLAAFKRSPESKPADVVYRINAEHGWLEDPRLRCIADVKTKLCTLFATCLKSLDTPPSTSPQVIVIYDRVHPLRAYGFRHCAANTTFDRFIDNNKHFDNGAGIIIWNRTYPFESDNPKEELWPRLDKYRARTIAVIKYGCLSRAGLRINEDSSVEQLIEDCVAQERHPILLRLKRCRHVVVTFRDAVLHWDTDKPGFVKYHYCPNLIDEQIQPHYGRMAGNTIILVASIVRSLLSPPTDSAPAPIDNVDRGVRLGTVLGAHHYRRGFTGPDFYEETDFADPQKSLADENGYPFHLRKVFDAPELANSEVKSGTRVTRKEYLLTSLECDTQAAADCQISRTGIYFKQLASASNGHHSIAEDKIAEVVCRGLEASTTTKSPYGEYPPNSLDRWFPESEVACPVAFFAHLQTTDRDEIENYMALHTLIGNYLEDKKLDKPFSIATFGTPGSGKSFAIKQIVESIDEDAARAPLEFNVSQFTGIADLVAAFHQAHDRSMQGNSLVIFDEFDAFFEGPLGWLKYFLAPMQDGVFRDKGASYHVGRAIFLFTGGTTSTFKEFYTDRKDELGFRSAKGPDFVSRLRGYMNIPRFSSDTTLDHSALFRRAIILRSILERKLERIIDKASQVARIDRQVINAFLKTRKYEHEVRSMEAIVEMSKVTGSGFRKSSLPTPEQLSLHVDPDEFLGHLNRP